jgi:hypothetical protein
VFVLPVVFLTALEHLVIAVALKPVVFFITLVLFGAVVAFIILAQLTIGMAFGTRRVITV